MLTPYPMEPKQNNYNFSDGRLFPYATGLNDTGGAPSVVNISKNVRKKFETALMRYSDAWGKRIHEKKPEVENLVPLSF
jgi:hypothetical protein